MSSNSSSAILREYRFRELKKPPRVVYVERMTPGCRSGVSVLTRCCIAVAVGDQGSGPPPSGLLGGPGLASGVLSSALCMGPLLAVWPVCPRLLH